LEVLNLPASPDFFLRLKRPRRTFFSHASLYEVRAIELKWKIGDAGTLFPLTRQLRSCVRFIYPLETARFFLCASSTLELAFLADEMPVFFFRRPSEVVFC